MKNLFRFENSSLNGPSGSPKLVPAGGGGVSSLSKNFLNLDSISSNPEGLIDVINGFHWTSSQPSSRQDVPEILLKEKRLRTNSLYAQLAYYGLALSDRGGEVSGRLNNLLAGSKLGSGLLDGILNGLSSIGLGNVLGIGEKFLGAASSFGNAIVNSGAIELLTGKSGQDFVNQMRIGGGSSGASGTLSPYEGLYLTDDTKFQYKFPYFSDGAYLASNQFNDDDTVINKGIGGKAKEIVSGIEQLAYGTAQLTGGLMEPGVYIEKPKFYQFGASGDSITFSFPLINTGWAKIEDVQKNWQLIYMLIYQNRPNRKTRDLIDPPCLYEVVIPGVKYWPYSFISKLQVDFIGSRKAYNINIPSNGSGTARIQTIIPEAYNVSITVTSLVSETQNFLYHMLFEKQGIVNVLQSSGASNPIESFITGLQRGLGTL
jgi:hypothetical protein